MAIVLPCAGYYLLASSNPDVSSGAYNWWMVVVETPLTMHTYKFYSIFLPMGRVLSACLCWSLLPSKCATYHHTIHLCCCVQLISLLNLYSDLHPYTSHPAYIQLSRCDAGVLSCVSLLPDLLCHLSDHYTVYHCQCGKHMIITVT